MSLFDRVRAVREQVVGMLDNAKIRHDIERYESELQENPENLHAMQELGTLYQEGSELQKSVDMLCRIAEIHRQRNEFEQMLAFYRKAERLATGDGRLDILKKLVEVSIQLRRFDDAYPRARQVVEFMMARSAAAEAVAFIDALPNLGVKDILYRSELKVLAGVPREEASPGETGSSWIVEGVTPVTPAQAMRETDEHFPEQTILLVDDEPGILQVLLTCLRSLGARLITATNGQEATEKVLTDYPTLIISDLNMPDMDGSQFFDWLRAQPTFAATPFVCLSSVSDEMEKLAAFDRGVEDYWTKPFRPAEVAHRVRRLLRRVRPPVDLLGKLSQIAFPEVIQILDSGRKTGVLTIQSDAGEAVLYFKEGHIADAEFGAIRGERAMFEIIGWLSGEFTFRSCPVTRETAIELNAQQLLMEAFRRYDEAQYLISELPDRDATYLCGDDFERAPEVADEIAQEGEFAANIGRIRSLFDGRRSLGQCLDALSGDLETLLLVKELIDRKLLVPGQEILL